MSFYKDEDKIKPVNGEEEKELNEEQYYEDSATRTLHPNSIFREKKTLGGG